MAKIKRNWDLISKQKREECISKTIDFFQTERDEEIGMIAAETILDHFLQTAGIQLYNKGIEDSISVLHDRFEGLELDIDLLKK